MFDYSNTIVNKPKTSFGSIAGDLQQDALDTKVTIEGNKHKSAAKELSEKAIVAGNFPMYQIGIMHDWLTTMTLLAIFLIPLFFVLDLFMMPSALLPRFAVYRGLSTLLAMLQFIIVRRSRPSVWSYIHVYFLSFQVGAIIAIMTRDLGGFNSSYYAGLCLIMVAVNLLMPWQAYHAAINVGLTLAMYVGINALAGLPYDKSMLLNNLFFLSATAIIVASINNVRFLLIRKEFFLLVELENARHALFSEKELVDDRNKSIKSLLDVSGQGFLSFDSAFKVSPEYSRECEQIFGRPIEGLLIADLLYENSDLRSEFMQGLELFFLGKSKSDVVFDLLDHSLRIGLRTVKVEYMAVHASRVMVVLTDITEELRLQEEFRNENDRRTTLLKVIANRQAFASLNREAKDFFGKLGVRMHGGESVIRDLHTFKANAGFIGFRKTNKAAHELEDVWTTNLALGLDVSPDTSSLILKDSYEQEYREIIEALGAAWDTDAESIEISHSAFFEIEEYIRNECPDGRILDIMEAYRKKPLSDLFGRFPHMVAELSARMGKKILPVTVTGGRIPVFPEEFETLIESFTHLVRNMVDHGIETPRKRESLGKSPEGEITIDIAEDENGLIFSYADNGQGIQLAEIEKKAMEQGLLEKSGTATNAELLQFIFRDNFSTAGSVSDISGRGIGLASVRQAVKKMNGNIKVKTERNQGTLFTITIPRSRRRRKETVQ